MRTPKGKIKRKIMKGWVSSLFDEFCLSQKKRSKEKDFYWSVFGAKEKNALAALSFDACPDICGHA